MSTKMIPAFFDGEDRTGTPVFVKSTAEIRQLRKDRTLEGWFQDNGNVFVIYRKRVERSMAEIERALVASTMRAAWATRQSGYAGPLVLQMRTSEAVIG